MPFMMNKLAKIDSCEIILENFFLPKIIVKFIAHYTCTQIILNKIWYLQKLFIMLSSKAWVQRPSGQIEIRRKHKRFKWRTGDCTIALIKVENLL